MSSDATTLKEISEDLEEASETEDEVTVGDLMEVAGHRGIALFILIPALVGISPVGMIPSVPSLLALIVFFFAVQIAMGRDYMWLPEVLKSRGVDDDRFGRAVSKIKPVLEKLDGWFGQRLEWLAGDGALRIAAVVVLALCLAVPPLEFLPAAAVVPLIAIAAFGLALSVKDGVLMLLAFAVTAIVAYLVIMAL